MFLHYRTLILGLLLMLLYLFIVIKRPASTIRISLLYCLAAAGIVLFFLNNQSSLGRWFVLKRAGSIFWHNWPGGADAYNPAFNHYQAAYFSRQPNLHSHEALLAADGYYCNNEFLQLGIEHGWPATAALLLITAYFFYRLYTSLYKTGWRREYIIIAALIPFVTGLFFSYPLHNWWLFITFYTLCCLLVTETPLCRQYKKARFALLAVAIVPVMASVIIIQTRQAAFKRRFEQAVILAQTGFKQKAIAQLEALVNSPFIQQNYVTLLASLHYGTGRIQKAIQLIERYHYRVCSHSLHAMLGNYYLQLGDTAQARHHYFTCLYIKPSLLQSRLNLAKYYAAVEKRDSVLYWLHDLLNYPVKIESHRTEAVRLQAIQLLNSITKNVVSVTKIKRLPSREKYPAARCKIPCPGKIAAPSLLHDNDNSYTPGGTPQTKPAANNRSSTTCVDWFWVHTVYDPETGWIISQTETYLGTTCTGCLPNTNQPQTTITAETEWDCMAGTGGSEPEEVQVSKEKGWHAFYGDVYGVTATVWATDRLKGKRRSGEPQGGHFTKITFLGLGCNTSGISYDYTYQHAECSEQTASSRVITRVTRNNLPYKSDDRRKDYTFAEVFN